MSTIKIIVVVVGVFFVGNLFFFGNSWERTGRSLKLVIRELIKANLFILSWLSLIALAFWLYMR